ncbi:glutamate 2,3-aminomutase [Pectinatus sottacetonis]|uniref:glutamate 2,3-aminomutase n=1 Tax=Pectinatus sottacetonis TaxID=1002795 RepID=UPI0018C56B3E|nr:glutamate 2,3-aminomutase [Pectinatus sottacetonis]
MNSYKKIRKIVNFTEEEKRDMALKRVTTLKKKIKNYIEKKASIKTGFDIQDEYSAKKNLLLKYFSATNKDWNNWHWQLSHRITNVKNLRALSSFPDTVLKEIETVQSTFRWAVSPHYLSLINEKDPMDPIKMQSIPSIKETVHTGVADPMAEEFTSPAPCIVRRYPDRLIINVTNQCAMYCRHCQRRRNIGETDHQAAKTDINAALNYIRDNNEIRDVLVTGGDALLLNDNMLDWILTELDNIPHVEIKRIGTRTLVTLPQRVTDELCYILKKHPPVYINTQFNHPREITPESKTACDKLASAGVIMGNQSVLLKGINDDPDIIKKLNQELLKIRIRPYYLFQAKPVEGTMHFVTSIDKGLEIMKNLRGYTSGMAIPSYIVNAPNGYGKIPLLPEYIIDKHNNKLHLRTWEDRIIEYET